MGCLTHRRKAVTGGADQNWSYINLRDFKSTSCFTPFAYGYLWFLLFISIAVYGVDTFVAVNLLAFDNWSSQIDPAVDRDIAKWVFSACIIASFVNLGFEFVRAIRVMKRGNVAECYLDNLAVRLESIRMGKGQGWRRFLVFAALTKSKKGAEYIALFTYFNFQSWIRVLVCSGPRQVINALTLYSVYDADLASDETAFDKSFTGFFKNIEKLANDDYQQVIILSAMAFTLVIWAFSLLFLIVAIFFYVFFLWHWIPRADGGLSGYCERKVNDSLVKIVTQRVNKALAKEQKERLKAEARAAKGAGEKPGLLARQATLPTIPDVGPVGDDKLPEMPSLQRAETFATLPPYSSKPGTPGGIELGAMEQKRPPPSRSATGASQPYSTRAGLVANASEMGTSNPLSPAPSLPDFSRYGSPRPSSPGSGYARGPQPQSLRHQMSTSSVARYTETPANYDMPYPAPTRTPSTRTDGYPSLPAVPQDGRFSPFSPEGRSSPAPRGGGGGGFQAYQPSRSATGPAYGVQRPQQQQPARNMTDGGYFGHQPSERDGYGYDYDVESQRRW